MKKIKLGYEVGTGKEVSIDPSHLLVTGITQLSGKTTTLEALIKRSNLKAIVFRTKPGEKSFLDGRVIPPFFTEHSDYDFVRSMIEAYAKERLNFERGTLMTLCKGSSGLDDIKNRVDAALKGKIRGLDREIYTRLQHYLENLLPQIKKANFSSTLFINRGINIMDIVSFSDEMQSLIIQSVADEVLANDKGVILVIPEAWKFLPQRYKTPCKRAVESFIRQGATNDNFVWIDSQEMAGIDKVPLKQISTWILGYQTERNEVKHTLDQISAPAKAKPAIDDIMTLQIGHFYLSTREKVVKVYVQPVWMDDQEAKQIAQGKKKVDQLNSRRVPASGSIDLAEPEYRKPPFSGIVDDSNPHVLMSYFKRELQEIRLDFFAKINDLNNQVLQLNYRISQLQTPSAAGIDEQEVISKVLQKMSLPPATNGVPGNIDTGAIVATVLREIESRGIAGSAGAVYQVAPLEKLKKDFLVQAKNKILADISNLSPDSKQMLKYIESRGQGVKTAELIAKCFLMKEGGFQRQKVSDAAKELLSIGVIKKDSAGWHRPNLAGRIGELLGNHSATDQEIQQTYDHILVELIQ